MNLPTLDALVAKLVGAALESDDKGFMLDVVKTLCPLYIAERKISGKKDEDEFVGETISEMRKQQIAATTPLIASAQRRAEGETRSRNRNGQYD